jgi:hypothetical protein
MISENELINILNKFSQELPELFSPYQASTFMDGWYENNWRKIKYMVRVGFLEKKPGDNLFYLTEKALDYLQDKQEVLKVAERDERIIKFIKKNPGSDKKKLAKFLKVSPASAYGFALDMEKRGLLVHEKEGNTNVYYLPGEQTPEPIPEVIVHEPLEILNHPSEPIGIINPNKFTVGKLLDELWPRIKEVSCNSCNKSSTHDHIRILFKDQTSLIDSFNELPDPIQKSAEITMNPYTKTYLMNLEIAI